MRRSCVQEHTCHIPQQHIPKRSRMVKCLTLKNTIRGKTLAAKHKSSPPIKTRWQLGDRNRACKWGSVFPGRKVMSFDNNDAVKWDTAREKSLAGERLQLWLQDCFNLFQLPANTDYVTADLQCTPGPLKYLKSMCAVAVARQWSLAWWKFVWKTHRSLRYTRAHTTFTTKPLQREKYQTSRELMQS